MANSRSLHWGAALRDIKSDHLARQPIREERLRATAGLRTSASCAVALSAWRGASSKRYVVGVHPLNALILEDAAEAVVLAVRRDEIGIAYIVAVRDMPPCTTTLDCRAWVEAVRRDGATELHTHRYAGGPAERAAVVADLTEPKPALQTVA